MTHSRYSINISILFLFLFNPRHQFCKACRGFDYKQHHFTEANQHHYEFWDYLCRDHRICYRAQKHFCLVLQGLCGATHLLSHTKNTIDRLGNTTSIRTVWCLLLANLCQVFQFPQDSFPFDLLHIERERERKVTQATVRAFSYSTVKWKEQHPFSSFAMRSEWDKYGCMPNSW